MSPLGHLSCSYLAGQTLKNCHMPAILLGGVLPDIDFLLLPFSFFNQIHRLATHNLLFIVLLAVGIGWWTAKGNRLNFVFSLFLGGLLHLLVDSCLDSNPSNGIGVPLLWPFYDQYFSPFNLFQPLETTVGWGRPFEMIKRSLQVMVWEFPFYVLTIILIFKKRRSGKVA